MSKTYFISDTHFFHRNCITYCNRPFDDTAEMNHYIIDRWNSTIKEDDTVFFLGDFALGQCSKEDVYKEYSRILNGNIYFLKGNHDMSYKTLDKYFDCISEGHLFYHKGFNFILSHYPLPDYSIPDNCFNIHGHIHNTSYDKLDAVFNLDYHINVSADANDFTPIDADDIISQIENGKYKAKLFAHYQKEVNMRKLATIEKIIDIRPIPGADSIETAIVKGWEVVVQKNEFSVGESVVYFEIDSLIPKTDVTEFLMKNPDDEVARLKTIKLRGQVSQGLLLSLGQAYRMHHELNGDDTEPFGESIGTDLSDILHIEKYEPEVKYGDEGATVYWPFNISKTDEERIQNIPEIIDEIIESKEHLCVSVKLDGTSMTVINTPNGIEAAGRNNCFLKDDDVAYNNKYWATARKYNLPGVLEKASLEDNVLYAVQGELVGPGVQKNKMNLSELHFYIFNLFKSDNKGSSWTKLGYNELINFCDKYGLEHVPYIYSDLDLKLNDLTSVRALLEFSKGTYRDNAEGYFPNAKEKQQREGLVFRTLDHSKSFKVINNDFLINGGC